VRTLVVTALVAALATSLAAQVAPQSGVLGPVNALGQEVKRPLAPTGPAPRLPDGTIDLGDGIWVVVPQSAQASMRSAEALLLPSAKAVLASRSKGTDDPSAWCLPSSVLRYGPYPFRFIQNYTHRQPTHLYILFELKNTFRQVFLDGRTHPADLDPTWLGHSIGRYEKDALVIDTVGFNDKSWLDNRGMPNTDRLHTIERWTRVDAGHLTSEVTVDDPGAYSRPFTVTTQMTIAPAGDEMMEYVCQENNQFGIASGAR
jgi:hypothetical protein